MKKGIAIVLLVLMVMGGLYGCSKSDELSSKDRAQISRLETVKKEMQYSLEGLDRYVEVVNILVEGAETSDELKDKVAEYSDIIKDSVVQQFAEMTVASDDLGGDLNEMSPEELAEYKEWLNKYLNGEIESKRVEVESTVEDEDESGENESGEGIGYSYSGVKDNTGLLTDDDIDTIAFELNRISTELGVETSVEIGYDDENGIDIAISVGNSVTHYSYEESEKTLAESIIEFIGNTNNESLSEEESESKNEESVSEIEESVSEIEESEDEREESESEREGAGSDNESVPVYDIDYSYDNTEESQESAISVVEVYYKMIIMTRVTNYGTLYYKVDLDDNAVITDINVYVYVG